VVALIHDVIVALGLIALSPVIAQTAVGKALLVTPFKIDMTVIAAFLTIIGYSVNDTIVIFDRIRENRGKMPSVNRTMINHAINQTLGRTLLTSSAVIIALIVMYAVGGAGIHAFCFAMLIGVVTGTYSSFAIASPLLILFRPEAGRVVPRPQPLPAPAPAPAQPVAK
jgi:SecD/SecF fusion protein